MPSLTQTEAVARAAAIAVESYDIDLDLTADGSFRSVDTRVVARAIMSVNQWAWTWYEPDDARPPEAVAAQFNDLFQGGLLNDRTGRPETSTLSDHIAPVVRSIIAAQPNAG